MTSRIASIAAWLALSAFTGDGCGSTASSQPALTQETWDVCRAGCWWTLNDDMHQQCMLRCTFKARGIRYSRY